MGRGQQRHAILRPFFQVHLGEPVLSLEQPLDFMSLMSFLPLNL